jgi:D-cysteine desulfhydrase
MSEWIPRDRRAPRLFAELPGLASVPFRPLAHVPTRVDVCDAIAPWLGRSGVFMKRDDLISPLYGGNKVRRFEFVLADAEARGAKRIVTTGGIASTQVMATAMFARACGFGVRAVLFDQPLTRFAQNAVLTDASASVELIWGGGYLTTAARTLAAYLRDEGNYFVPPGASDPISNLGYIDAMFELRDQVERGELPRPDVIVLPTGSSGTLAALALGAAHLGWDTEIVGVRITARIACNRITIGHVIRRTNNYIAEREPRWHARTPRWSLHHGAIGAGYGYPTPEAIEASLQVKSLIGTEGEVTYTGKALAGLRAIVADARYRNKNILLWNTLSAVTPELAPDARARVPRSLQWMFERPVVA